MKYPIKLIASDLDGTLLRTDKTISELTKNTLMQCRKQGIKVVFATGRGGSVDHVAAPELFDGRIMMNGAVAYINDDIIYCRLIPYQTARPVLIACDQRGMKTSSERNGMHYSNFGVSKEWARISNFEIVDFSKHELDAEKLYAIIQEPEDAAFIEKNLPDDLYLTLSRDGLMQIMHREATKSKALSELARIWGIAQSEIAAFGDDMNDIDMLSYAGLGVAMGNALEEVKAAADFICPDNDDDGLAHWIRSNLL